MQRTTFTGLAAAVVFVTLASYRLERPGLYYDELHQAPSAFAYVGRPSPGFAAMTVWGLPLLNMPYSGAIKSAVYGVYLRLSGRPFSILSWRLLGILFSAAGIVGFCVLAGDRLPIAALLLFLGLLVSDTNLLLQSRHDWGPVALAFLLRMLFMGLCVRHLVTDTDKYRLRVFLLGLIVGWSILEKLSSTVLLGPLALVLLMDARTRTVRSGILASAGVLLGSAPVIGANVFTWVTSGTLVSLSGTHAPPGPPVLAFAPRYLALGNGGALRVFIFDVTRLLWPVWGAEWLEATAVLTLVAVVVVAGHRSRAHRLRRLAAMAASSYLAIALGLHFLPTKTAVHHWIIGTPFQYLAIALLVPLIWSGSSRAWRLRIVTAACFSGLALSRADALISTMDAIRGDKYSLVIHPSINEAARFAARQPENTVFIAADWGIATQVLSLANGRQNFVYEPFWDYRGDATLDDILTPSTRRALVARLRPPIGLGGQSTTRIFEDLAGRPDWVEVAVEPSIGVLPAVEMRAFERQSR